MLLLLLYAISSSARGELSPKALEFFESRIRPVLTQDCYECHRSSGKRKGGLALDSRQGLLDGGDSGKVLVPGRPNESLLIKAIRHESEDLKMPKARAKLEASVIADFEEWVRMGAPDPRDAPATEAQVAADTDWEAVMKRRKNWWSFQPLGKTDLSKLPAESGSNHPVDRFLAVKLAQAGLPRAALADRRTLIRRLSYTLRGLPPSAEEIDAFLRDLDNGAYARLVDSFLASPRFGECWARHWMDWIRYADSHGSEGDPLIPYAWQYRDYLIRALNDDVPYDQLLREHLAGDLLKKPRINRELGLNESALGIGHLRMVFHGFAPTDALEEQVRFTDDQISVVSKAFLGLTVSCARCHNHKFDPISQKDFYGWYGIFVSCPPATIAVDAPDPESPKRRRELVKRKTEIKAALAEIWLRDCPIMAQKLAEPSDALKKVMDTAKDASSVMYPFFVLRHQDQKTNETMATWWQKSREAIAHTNRTSTKRWSFANSRDFVSWRNDGPGVAEVSPAGSFALAADGEKIVAGIYPSGVYSHLISTKDRGVVLSPRIKLDDKYDLWLSVAGDGGAMARYVVQNYPRDGTVFPVTKLSGGQWQWLKLGLDYWQGDRIHVEITTAADQPVLADINAKRSWFGLSSVSLIHQGEPGPNSGWPFADIVFAALDNQMPTNVVDLVKSYAAATCAAIQAWREDTITDNQALFLDQMLKSGLLQNQLTNMQGLNPLVASYRAQESSIRSPTRAPGVLETEPIDQPLLLRGDHKQPREPVNRRFLDAIDISPYPGTESGRRQLAEDFLRPDNPLTSRVIVNRIWHHVFGRGIVATPDNFGRMGQQPSHPELLDFLANWFVEHGYSIKSLVRFLVTTKTFQTMSETPQGAMEKDPENVLLSHFNVRRLEAEAIRDALLSVSGDLKTQEMYGPPIVGQTPRRSVYLRVKRNELDPFLSAFDAPVPASTTGKRDVTNVPGQSLALLNDPFVIDLSEHWAERIEQDPDLKDTPRRIEAMFICALGRPPVKNELARSEKFLQWSSAQHQEMKTNRAQLEQIITNNTSSLAALRTAAMERVFSLHKASTNAQPLSSLPQPIASWDFNEGPMDQIGSIESRLFGNAKVQNGALVLDGNSSYVASMPLARNLKAKTLEARVQLSDLKQQGGGVMTVQDLAGNVFDSIVIGEKKSQHWLAGSDFFNRTQDFEGTPETEAKDAPVHLTIVYAEDGTITGYRNGKIYGQPYKSSGPAKFEAGKSQVLFGNRHGEPGGNKNLAGRIFQARLYDRALTAEEIETLAGSNSGTMSQKTIEENMTESERTQYLKVKEDLALAEDSLKSLNKVRGLSSEWADLAQAMFNLKEFIYIR